MAAGPRAKRPPHNRLVAVGLSVDGGAGVRGPDMTEGYSLS
jgi:hypothetical protein